MSKYIEFPSVKEAVLWSQDEARRRGSKGSDDTKYQYEAEENSKTGVAVVRIPDADIPLLVSGDQKKLKDRAGTASDWAPTVMEPKP